MICKIADIFVDIPAAGDMISRCWEYKVDEKVEPNITLLYETFNHQRWKWLDENGVVYMESGDWFYKYLLNYNGMMLHSSAVELNGKAYLFSGPCGVGKSTHTSLWKEVFGVSAQIFNDDKPALRRIENKWYAYGTPWSGKNGINQNKKVPLAGICFLKKGDINSIVKLSISEAAYNILSQTFHKFRKIENLDKVLSLVDQLIREIPIYELTNRPEPEAAILSYETMRKGAEEAGL